LLHAGEPLVDDILISFLERLAHKTAVNYFIYTLWVYFMIY